MGTLHEMQNNLKLAYKFIKPYLGTGWLVAQRFLTPKAQDMVTQV